MSLEDDGGDDAGGCVGSHKRMMVVMMLVAALVVIIVAMSEVPKSKRKWNTTPLRRYLQGGTRCVVLAQCYVMLPPSTQYSANPM